jgi:hypothetical protein
MIRRTVYALGVCVVLAAVSAGGAAAAAGGAGTETTTSHEIEAFSFPAANACTGEEGVLTASPSTSVFHITTHADGTSWITGTSQGTATFVPAGPGPVFTGHFTAWFGEAANRKNTVEHDTSTFTLSGPEGSRVVVHSRSHLSTNAKGVVTVEVEREHTHEKCV